MINSNYISSFYHDQNIQIRRQIRQLDMQFKDLKNSKQTKDDISKLQTNFLVIGPSKSGKSSLLKTMHYALNSNNNVPISVNELGLTVIKRFQIKKSKRLQVQGLVKLKETQAKKTISAYQFQLRNNIYTNYSLNNSQMKPEEKAGKLFQKYSNALQIIDNKIFGCFKVNSTKSQMNIKVVLIVIDILGKTQYEQITCLKFFISDLYQKGIRPFLVLTQMDKLNKMKQNDKLLFVQQRISNLCKELQLKDREDIICIQSYHGKQQVYYGNKINHKQEIQFENNEEINYYSLKLMQRIIKQADKYSKELKSKKMKWFCG